MFGRGGWEEFSIACDVEHRDRLTHSKCAARLCHWKHSVSYNQSDVAGGDWWAETRDVGSSSTPAA